MNDDRRVDRLSAMRPSAIREIHDLYQRLRQENPSRSFIPLHFGQPDRGTPPFIIEAACTALHEGAVFYENNSGRVDLKEALAIHHGRRLGIDLHPDHFVITCGGTQAIALATLALLAPGDQVVAVTPSWPNLIESARIAGATVHEMPLSFHEQARVFELDFNRLAQVVDRLDHLRLIIVNSPSNPTGWVISNAQQNLLLELCEKRACYLLSDEIYDRIVFCNPPFRSALSAPGAARMQDRLILINGFSKTYCMTGWRIGYLIAEPALAAKMARMQEFLTSCAPSMAQVAAIIALRDGEPFIAESLERYRALRSLALEGLGNLPGVTVARPDGTFYLFFRATGSQDSIPFCKDLMIQTGVILAPGNAFTAGSEGWLRLCFAAEADQLEEAIARIGQFMIKKEH